MAARFQGLLKNRLGATARPNGTFHAQRVVTTAIQRIRWDVNNGAQVTESGPEFLARFERLLPRFPDDWILRAIHVSLLMQTADASHGEALLRQYIQNPPDSCEGHSRLGTLLKQQGRLADAMADYMDEVCRWPWNHRAVSRSRADFV